MKFVFIGHVDHGKSTLGGQILVKTGNINNRDIKKIKKKAKELKMPSWWLAHILDESEFEKVKGKTYYFHVYSFKYKEKDYEIIDVPGHKEYVNQMIYGASMADVAVLILSIRKGEYNDGINGGESINHTLIARGMGIKSLIVCVNKMDTINWNVEKYNFIVKDFLKFIKKFKFEDVIFVPMSAYLGDNIIDRYDHPLVTCSFIEALDGIKIVPKYTRLVKPENYRVKCELIFWCVNNVIANGYVCKLHTNDELFNAKFVEIKNDKYFFITKNNSKGKIVNVVLELNTNEPIHDKIILRDGNQTIAIGILD